MKYKESSNTLLYVSHCYSTLHTPILVHFYFVMFLNEDTWGDVGVGWVILIS